MIVLVVPPFLVALLACLVGAARASRPRGREIETAEVVFGAFFGALLIATGPLVAYFRLGRALAEHLIVLLLVWLASLAPLAFWLLLLFLATANIVSCPQDAYECPL